MSDDSRPISIQITSGTIFKGLAILVAFIAIYLVRDVVLILLTALVIASAIEPLVRWLTGHKVPRVLAVIMIYGLFIGLLLVGTFVFIPPMLTEVSRISDVLPQYIQNFKFSELIPGIVPSQASLLGDQFFNTASLKQGLDAIHNGLAGLSQGFFQTAATIFGGALSAILILVISFYLSVEERGIESFLRVIIPMPREQYVIGLWRRTQAKIGLWLQGQLLLAIVVGVLVYLGLTILGVPYAITLAVLAALFEIIPVFGPILSAIPAAIVAFGVSASLGFMVIGLYIIVQQFENHLITPLVITKIVGTPPIFVIVALLVGAKLAGFLGILLAVPLTTIVVELFKDLEKQKLAQAAKS